MTTGHFDRGYWKFLKKIQEAGGVPCEDNGEIFYPEDFPNQNLRKLAEATAKRLCNTCPIKNDCLAYAIESNQRFGIWAGTLPTER